MLELANGFLIHHGDRLHSPMQGIVVKAMFKLVNLSSFEQGAVLTFALGSAQGTFWTMSGVVATVRLGFSNDWVCTCKKGAHCL